jgi:hypothetical protein
MSPPRPDLALHHLPSAGLGTVPSVGLGTVPSLFLHYKFQTGDFFPHSLSGFDVLHVFCCTVVSLVVLHPTWIWATRVRVRQRPNRYCACVSTLVEHRSRLCSSSIFAIELTVRGRVTFCEHDCEINQSLACRIDLVPRLLVVVRIRL